MSKTELPTVFTKSDNYKGKSIISFSSAGRYFNLGTDQNKPIVISGPIHELMTKLIQEAGETNHPKQEKEYLKNLPSSLPTLCRLIQIQFPNVFIHLVSSNYANGTVKSKLVISGRVSYQGKFQEKWICYYPANRSLIVRKPAETDQEFEDLTGLKKSEWNYEEIPMVSRHYRLGNMKKYPEEQVQEVENLEKMIIEKGEQVNPITQVDQAYQVICQWLNDSIKKVSPLKKEEETKPSQKNQPQKNNSKNHNHSRNYYKNHSRNHNNSQGQKN